MTDPTQGLVAAINGPIVTLKAPGLRNGEQVRIGTLGVIAEVIGLEADTAVAQAYEPTEGLRPGDPIERTGQPLSVELGPGLLGQTFDGVQRPLDVIHRDTGRRIPRGLRVDALDRARRWDFQPNGDLRPGDALRGGAVLGSLPETGAITHRVLVPPLLDGELLELALPGNYTVDDVIGCVRCTDGSDHDLRLAHRWPVRKPRPYRSRDHAVAPLITGQRILDTFFPLLKGDKAAIPGPFGAGKTVLHQQIARWSNADIVIFVGCGERGNELVEILEEFPRLTDPATGRLLMERTLMVANTSNMPVVAREASVYVGITIAEYYRDQGYDVLLLADSTSRWAEAQREVAARLGHMPVEEGYPAYLASRLAAFYERAGRVETRSGARGSVTLIGSVSPPGGDFSEPVTNHTKEIIQTFWALSKELADARHYPAIDWVESFSEHVTTTAAWWTENVDARWDELRARALSLLARDAELSRIVNLVGPEALSSAQRWDLEGGALLKDGMLQQNALEPVDSFCAPHKQFALLRLILEIHQRGSELIALGTPVQELTALPLLSEARRYKEDFDNQRISELRAQLDRIRDAFDPIRLQYTQPREAT